jgi:hypothetical protein
MSTEVPKNTIGMTEEEANALISSHTMAEADAQKLVDSYNEPSGFDIALDIAQGVSKGPLNAIKEGAKTLSGAFGEEAETPLMNWLLEQTGTLDTTPGKVTEGFSRAISSYALLRGYGTATTIPGKFAEVATKGAAVDFTIWGKDDGRLANLLADNGADNVVVNYLKSDPTDSVLEDKFKHAVEGLLMGMVSEATITSITAGYRAAKAKLWAKGKLPEEIAKEVDEALEAGKIIPAATKTTKTADEVAQDATVAKVEKEIASEAPELKYQEGFKKEREVYTDKPPYTAFNYEKILAGIDESAHKEATAILENITKTEDFIRYAKTGVKPQEVTIKQAEVLRKKLGFEGVLELAHKTTKTAAELDAHLVLLKREMVGQFDSLIKDIVTSKPSDKVALINTLRQLRPLSILAAGSKSLQQGGARVTVAGRLDIVPEGLFEQLDEIQKLSPDILSKEADKIIDDVTAKRIHKELKKLADIESDVTLHRVMKGINKDDKWLKKTVNVLTELRLTSLLSGPVTLMKNIAGNYTVRKASNAEYRMAGIIGRIRGDADRFTKDEVEALTNGSSHQARETLDNFIKAIKQIPNGSTVEYNKAMTKANKISEEMANTVDPTILKQLEEQHISALKAAEKVKPYEDALEESYLDFYQKYDTGSYRAISSNYLMKNTDTPLRQSIGKTVDGIGALIRTPYQALGVTDDMFKRVIYGSEMKYIATREANIAGLEGVDKQKFIEGFYKAHEALFLKKAGKDLTEDQANLVKQYVASNKGKFHLEAIERAREGTFQEELRATGAINTTVKKVDEIIKGIPGGQWIVPFYRTPVNILKWVGRRTPGVHKLSQRMTDDIAAGGRRKALAESRLVMGTSLYAVSGLLAYNNMITGTAPAGEREAWKAAGIQENSIYNPFTDEWVPFNGLDPVGMFLGLTAEFNMFITDMHRQGKFLLDDEDVLEDINEFTGAMVTMLTNQVVSKSWMESLDQFLRWTKGQNPTFAERQQATFLPFGSFVNFIQNGEGDELKEAMGLFESIKKKYAPDTLRGGLDIFGKKQQLTSFLGMRTRKPNLTPARKEIFRLKTEIPRMSKKITHLGAEIELEPEDYHKMRLLVDTKYHLEERLDALVQSSEYKVLPDGIDYTEVGKRKAIQTLFSEIHADARRSFIGSNKDRLDELKDALDKKLGTLKNKRKGLYERWMEN